MSFNGYMAGVNQWAEDNYRHINYGSQVKFASTEFFPQNDTNKVPFDVPNENGLSKLGAHMQQKIARELGTVALNGRFGPITDSDANFLLKEAGMDIQCSSAPWLPEFIESAMYKVAYGVRLTPIEQLFIKTSSVLSEAVGSGARAIESGVLESGVGAAEEGVSRFLPEVKKLEKLQTNTTKGVLVETTSEPKIYKKIVEQPVEKPKYPLLGSVGRWAALGVPVAGLAGYILGNSKGYGRGQMALSNALSQRMTALQQPNQMYSYNRR